MRNVKEVTTALKRYNNFLITAHINSEGDSIGSQLAMAALLKKLKKRYIIFDNDPVPKSLRFLLGNEVIKTRLTKKDKFDVVVSVDCPTIARTGKVAVYFADAKCVINIDHHVSNKKFGDILWIEPDMSSCGEMLYYLYGNMGVAIDKRAALLMYVAILTDTGYFSYENTTYKTHEIVSELLKTGIKPLWVGKQLNEAKSVNDLKLLNETLNTLKLHYDNQVATLYTTKKMLRRLNLKPESAEGFVNYGRSINTAKVAIFFLERPDKPGEVHVSFRSKGAVDVNRLAKVFKGGGHVNASGCLIKGSIAHAQKTILPQTKLFL